MIAIVYHLNYEAAIAHGLASKTQHIFPYTDATCGFSKRHVEAVQALWDAHCYTPVVSINIGDPMSAMGLDRKLEQVFEGTNSIDEHWSRKYESNSNAVLFSLNNRQRSTSVGDVIKVVNLGTQRLFRIASCGFEALTDWTTIKEAV